MSYFRKNYGDKIQTKTGMELTPKQVNRVAVAGSIVAIRGGDLWNDS